MDRSVTADGQDRVIATGGQISSQKQAMPGALGEGSVYLDPCLGEPNGDLPPAHERFPAARSRIDNCGYSSQIAHVRAHAIAILRLLKWTWKGSSLAKRQQQELSEAAAERITRVVRSLADDRVERGVDLSRPMMCDSCDREKASAGSALFGAYKLCNDCLLEFTFALARGSVETAAEYMTSQPDGDEQLPPSDLSDQPERSVLSFGPIPGRDKLVPRNEPC